MYKDIAVLDLHIHTKYSIACSRDADLEGYSQLGLKKGIDYLGTGDMFKSEHLDDMKKHLSECDKGVYEYHKQKFFITGEISLIYREHDIVKKVHLLLILSSVKSAYALKKIFSAYGKLESNGRPILKISVRDAVRMVKDLDNDAIIIPAHIWTPHFGILGKKSGYDSLHESIEHIEYFSALETGLSSDPAMNRYVEELDVFNLVSFSDAHSPGRIGREFTYVKSKGLNINTLKDALENKNDMLIGTAEFYPQEGKYFASGHRKCNYSTLNNEHICPVCNKTLTDGVMSRIKQLSSRKSPIAHNKEVIYVLPLELIAKMLKKRKMGKSEKSILKILGDAMPESHLKAFADKIEIDRILPYGIGYMIEKIRKGKLKFNPGFDGVYGQPVFKEE